MTRIGVVGVGAIGGSLAGFMALNGEDVTFIDPWRNHVKAIRENGLILADAAVEYPVETDALQNVEKIGGSLSIRPEPFDKLRTGFVEGQP